MHTKMEKRLIEEEIMCKMEQYTLKLKYFN